MTDLHLDAPDDAADVSDVRAAEALTSKPDDGSAPLPSLGRIRALWRRFTSMRTALQLLFLLALAAVPGSLLPQRGQQTPEVTTFFTNHPHLAPVLDKLSLFDVFSAPWFAAVYLLLFISLIGCLVPRIRLHARASRTRPPAVPRHVDRLPVSARWHTSVAPSEVAGAARQMLRGRRWRTAVDGEAVSAEKGYLRETGNLAFHVALVIMLAAVALGGLRGYQGEILLLEGDGFSNSPTLYDTFKPGVAFSQSELTPFTMKLDDFRATYDKGGEPNSYDAYVSWRPRPGVPMRPHDIVENHPLVIGDNWFTGGTKVYLAGHGYAPHIVVRDSAGTVLYDGATTFLPRDSHNYTSDGVVKVANTSARSPKQVGLAGLFFPTYAMGAMGPVSTFPAPKDPRLLLTAYDGDLGLNGTPQSIYSLDFTHLTQMKDAKGGPLSFAMRVGDTHKLTNGDSVTFAGVTEFADFHINRDPGKRLALLAAVLIVSGLILSLRVRRRRIWVRARRDGDATLVEVGGLARTDPDTYAEEFERLVARLRQSAPSSDEVGTPT